MSRSRPLPVARGVALAQELVAAAALDDGGARLGELAGVASLDKRVAATVIGILARTALHVGYEAEIREEANRGLHKGHL